MVQQDEHLAHKRIQDTFRRFTRDTNSEARQYYIQAIQFDPGFARAYAEVALSHTDGWAQHLQVLVFSGEPEELLEKMTIAMELNPRYAFFYTWLDPALTIRQEARWMP